MFYANLGAVSAGTLKTEELLPRLLGQLAFLTGMEHAEEAPDKDRNGWLMKVKVKLWQAIDKRSQADGYYQTADPEFDLDALIAALDDYAPPFCRFGAHDGADFGFWVDPEAVREATVDGVIYPVDVGNDWPDDTLPADYILELGPHGKETLFERATRRKLWETG